MPNNAAIPLTDYQRAILTEVGVTYWRFLDPAKPVNAQVQVTRHQVQSEEINAIHLAPNAQVKSPQGALEALKQLKEEVVSPESTEKVLVALSNHEQQSEMLTDVLMAMGLEDKVVKHISTEQLSQFKDYPLSWQQGAKLALTENQLTTLPFGELKKPELKKQLWQLIQPWLNTAK